MSRILVINPNTSPEMTERIAAMAERAADGRVDVVTVRPEHGPLSVEGQLDEVVSAYWTLDLVSRQEQLYDGYLIACYSMHPVIGALRELVPAPVMGIMEASILHALPLGERFSVVTTSPRWEPLLREGVRALGFAGRLASVRSTGMAVLDLERLPAAAVARALASTASAAVESDGAEVICLGCAGMTGLDEVVRDATGVPAVDGVEAGIHLLAGLIESGRRTSPARLYAPAKMPVGVGQTMPRPVRGDRE